MAKTPLEAFTALSANPQAYASNVAGQLERIEDSKIVIVAKASELGLLDADDTSWTIDDAAKAVHGIQLFTANKLMETNTLALEEGYYKGVTITLGNVSEYYVLEEKTVTPSKAVQEVQPSEGKYGLSKVTVAPIPQAYQDVTEVTATADKVLVGSKFVAANGDVVDGAMANHSDLPETVRISTDTVVRDGGYLIEKGYHSGNTRVSIGLQDTVAITPTEQTQEVSYNESAFLSKVTVNPIPSKYKDVTKINLASSTQLVEGITAYSTDGTVLSGSIKNVTDEVDHEIDAAAGSYKVAANTVYRQGVNVTVKSTTVSPTFKAAGETISYQDHDDAYLTEVKIPAVPATGITAADILAGKEAYANGAKITGTMVDQSGNFPQSATLNKTATSQITLKPGYYDHEVKVGVKVDSVDAVTPTKSEQTISSETGYLTHVVVNAIPDEYQDVSAATIKSGDQLLKGAVAVGADGTAYTGTIETATSLTLGELKSSGATYPVTMSVEAGKFTGSGISKTHSFDVLEGVTVSGLDMDATGLVVAEVNFGSGSPAYAAKVVRNYEAFKLDSTIYDRLAAI